MTGPDQYVRVAPGPRDRTSQLTLNRPERSNAIDLAFAISLSQAAGNVKDQVQAGVVDCLLIQATGRYFCVGGDLTDFPVEPAAATAHLLRMSMLVHDAVATLLELPIPVVARVQGTVAGAGIGLAALADVVIADDQVRFRSGYPAVGLSPDCGISWLLPRLIGTRRAFDLLLSNRFVDAAEAQAWGLVSRIVPVTELDDEIASVLSAIHAAGRESTITTKRLLQAAGSDQLRAHLADEGQSIAQLAATEHAVTARTTFLDRERAGHGAAAARSENR